MKIEVGAKIKKTPFGFLKCSEDMCFAVKDMEGTIIDVNRKHRHFTVEYEFKNGAKIRETFKMNRTKAVSVHNWTVDK